MNKFNSVCLIVCLVFTAMILPSAAVAQDEETQEDTAQEDTAQEEGADQKQLRTRIVGTWTLDLEKCRELLDEADAKNLPPAMIKVELRFQDDGTLVMVSGDSSRNSRYKLELVEGSETELKCPIESDGRELVFRINFLEENVIKVAPENGDAPAILTRPMRELSLEDAQKIMAGKWKCDVQATKELPNRDAVPDEVLAKTSIWYTEDGSVLGIDSEEGADPLGTWTISNFEEESKRNHFKLKVKTNLQEVGTKNFTIQILDSNRFLMLEEDGSQTILVREKE